MSNDFATRKVVATTTIENVTNEEETKVSIEKCFGSLWIYFGENDTPDLVIDAVYDEIRVGIYEDDDMDIEPKIHVLKTVSGAW